MKLSETVLHGRGCCHSKGIAECSLQVLLTCPRSPLRSPHVSPSNSKDNHLAPLFTKQSDILTASTGKSTNGSCLKYIVNPARHHRHSVCTLEEQPHSGLKTVQQHLPAPSTNLVPAPTFHTGGSHVFMQRYKPSHIIATIEVGGVSPVTSSHFGKDHLESLCYSRELLVNATPTAQSPIPQSDDMPSPAQLSVILLKLRDELPSFFSDQHHHSYAMYSPDVVFVNNLLPFSCTLYSRWSYKCFLSTSRLLVRMGYSRVNLDLIRISKDVDAGKVEARWRIRGKPRLKLNEKVILDGYSEFCVNSDGLISRHHMDCMMPSKKRERSKVQRTLIDGRAPLAN